MPVLEIPPELRKPGSNSRIVGPCTECATGHIVVTIDHVVQQPQFFGSAGVLQLEPIWIPTEIGNPHCDKCGVTTQ